MNKLIINLNFHFSLVLENNFFFCFHFSTFSNRFKLAFVLLDDLYIVDLKNIIVIDFGFHDLFINWVYFDMISLINFSELIEGLG